MTDEIKDKASTDDASTKFEMFVRGLTDTQFAAAKAVVNNVDGERNGPDLNSMSDQQFDIYTRKLCAAGDKARKQG